MNTAATASFDSVLVKAGREHGKSAIAVNPPVHRASTYLFETLGDFEAAAQTPFDGPFYGRVGTPTTFAFEQAICELEGGHRTIATASGVAAISAALLAFLDHGDHVLVVDTVYDPVRRFCNRMLSRLGIETTYYDPAMGTDIAGLVRPETRVIYMESPGSGTFEIQDIRAIVEPYVRQSLPEGWIGADCVWHVNPTGKFVIGGPDGDSGLTGRKIIVDTYGGAAPHGGGAFSGKDTTKVDRSAAYAARYLAKNVVAAGLAERCTIQLAYAIGVAQPLSVYVDLHGTGRKATEEQVEQAIRAVMDLSPSGIRRHLDLNKPIYARTSAYGHFGRKAGRDGSFSWEKTDLTKALRQAVAAA